LLFTKRNKKTIYSYDIANQISKISENGDDNNPYVKVALNSTSKYNHSEDLQSGDFINYLGVLDVYFDDVVDMIERIWDLLDNYKEVSEALQRTSESLLTQRLNEVMKILTIFSVIMLPLTVITGFYGMNVVGLPIANHKLASEIIISLLIVIVVGMLVYFRRKKWL
jgi:hypothetical protein